MNRVLVIGATGTIGREVVSQLSSSGAPVRAMVRNPHSVRLPESVEVAVGNLTRPETLDQCLHGIDSVFLVWTAPSATVAPGSAASCKLRTTHRLSLVSAQNSTPLLSAAQFGSRTAPRLEWTFLRPGMFAANACGWWARQIRDGDVVRWPYAAAPTAPIHESDVAAVAVRALREDGHAGAEYVLTGPQS